MGFQKENKLGNKFLKGNTINLGRKSSEETKRKISIALKAKIRTLKDPRERFWGKVEKTDMCWIWKANKDKDGYGYFYYNGKQVLVHRFIFFLTYKKWPKKFILHHCDNPSCIRIDHLFEGTQKDNIQDAIKKGRFYQNMAFRFNKDK